MENPQKQVRDYQGLVQRCDYERKFNKKVMLSLFLVKPNRSCCSQPPTCTERIAPVLPYFYRDIFLAKQTTLDREDDREM